MGLVNGSTSKRLKGRRKEKPGYFFLSALGHIFWKVLQPPEQQLLSGCVSFTAPLLTGLLKTLFAFLCPEAAIASPLDGLQVSPHHFLVPLVLEHHRKENSLTSLEPAELDSISGRESDRKQKYNGGAVQKHIS